MKVSRYTLMNVLRVVADRYDDDAKQARDAGADRTAQQFEAQKAEALKLHDHLENGGPIDLTD